LYGHDRGRPLQQHASLNSLGVSARGLLDTDLSGDINHFQRQGRRLYRAWRRGFVWIKAFAAAKTYTDP
jgi:hypothetical protein